MIAVGFHHYTNITHMINKHNEGSRRSKKKMYKSRNYSKTTSGQASEEGD